MNNDNEEIKERIEHRDALIAIRDILTDSSGRFFMKYLFKHLEVGRLPELGLEGNILYDKLGFLRAGNAIFSLVCEANPQVASELLAENEKERHANLYGQS